MAAISEGTRRARLTPATLGLIFVAGAVGGTLLDQIHVRAHVLHYAHPALGGQAWWVAPQFGVTVVLLFVGAVEILKRDPSVGASLAADGAAFGIAYVLTGLLHRESWLVLSILIAMWLALISLHRERRVFVLVSVALAVIGPIYESILSATGAFRYDVTPLVARVPVWLPSLYLIGGVLATSAARAIARQR